MTKKKRQTNENYVKKTTPKHDAETSTFTRVAAEITSNREKSLTSQTLEPHQWNERDDRSVRNPRYPQIRTLREVGGRTLVVEPQEKFRHTDEWFVTRTNGRRKKPKQDSDTLCWTFPSPTMPRFFRQTDERRKFT